MRLRRTVEKKKRRFLSRGKEILLERIIYIYIVFSVSSQASRRHARRIPWELSTRPSKVHPFEEKSRRNG